MELFLALAARIATEYAFSAFAIALLMLPSYWIITNKRVLKIIDTSLNARLTQTSLYRVLRLGIILVFIFSITLVVFSFIAPWLMRTAENKSLAMVLYANEKFKNKDYSAARASYAQALQMSPDQPGADQIRGLVTATYYTQGLHEPGLQFICNQYRHKTQSERPFLFAVHAHLRALSVKNGGIYAEAAAQKFRRECGREDFSEFWAHIPFGMMESLRTGVLRAQHGWSLTPEAEARLGQLLREKRREAVRTLVPNADFALYFLSRFDELIRNMPDSSIRDSALFDAVNLASGAHDVSYLKMLVAQYPSSPHYVAALTALVARLAHDGMLDEAIKYVALLHGKEALAAATDTALTPTFDALRELTKAGDFKGALQLVNDVCAKFAALHMMCAPGVVGELRKLEKAVRVVDAIAAPENCMRSYGRLRPLLWNEDDHSLSTTWVRGVRSSLIACLPALSSLRPDEYAKVLYSVGSLSRSISDYDTSLEYLLRFDREIADHPLKDDVLVELGYHRLVVENDWPAAKKYFDTVLQQYPDRNAYDNALWWSAKGMRAQGDYAGAIAAYLEISGAQVAGRFRQWSSDEAKRLNYLQSIPVFQGVALRHVVLDDVSGMYVAEVAVQSPLAKFLTRQDHLVSVCGKNIQSIEQVVAIVTALRPDTQCNILYLRVNQLLRISGSIGQGWKTSSRRLSNDEIEALAFDPALF
jgi:tetratricopeptide (TPR) repeat protein